MSMGEYDGLDISRTASPVSFMYERDGNHPLSVQWLKPPKQLLGCMWALQNSLKLPGDRHQKIPHPV